MPGNETTRAGGLQVLTPDEVRSIMAALKARFGEIYAGRLRGVYLFGSYARHEASAESDVDVLIVLDHVPAYMTEIRRTGGVISELALAHDASITPVFVPERDWVEARTPFLQNARAEGTAAA